MAKKNNKNELSIKSKLLFNLLDSQNKVVLDLTQKDEKRVKSLNTIFDTYRMTLKPFIEDESKEYQEKVYAAVNDRRDSVEAMIKDKITVETLNMKIAPIMEHLKAMVSTCKTNLDTVNSILNIEK
jgi:hypothetical protein